MKVAQFLLIVGIVIAAVFAFSWLSLGLAHWLLPNSGPSVTWLRLTGAERVTLVAPGILMRNNTFNGVDGKMLEAIREHAGDILFVNYPERWFDLKRTVQMTNTAIVKLASQYRQIVAIGASLGGMVDYKALTTPSAESVDDSTTIRLVLGDPPDGPKSLGLGGNILGTILRFLPIGRGLLLGSLPFMLATPPKDYEIQPGLDKEMVKAFAKYRMSGFPTRVWADQLACMARFKFNAQASQMLARELESVIYLQATFGNETVKPSALDGWKKAFPNLQVIEVPTPHCAWLQQPVEWSWAFEEALRD